MMDNRKRHQEFLKMELIAETENFEKKFLAKARYLLDESEELFMGQFLKFDKGEMIVKFRASRAFPRKGEYVHSMYLPLDLQDYRQWRNLTYEDLFKNRLKGTETICIWQAKSKEEGFVLLGFIGVDVEFANYISQAPGALLFFGPNRPPIDYLANLYRLTQDIYNISVSDILDFPYTSIVTVPELIKDKHPSLFLYNNLISSDLVVLQGPPGTGKTQLISELCAKLCNEGKSVLITALTNRALIEVASKEALKCLLMQSKMFKSNLTIDEKDDLPGLNSLKQLVPMKGALTMATYYIVSGFAADLTGENVFDVVIMDEASQALLAMFAAANKIGKTKLWVGDTAQLGPVVSLNDDRIRDNSFEIFIDGMRTITSKRCLPLFQLTATYRLLQRSADYTGLFYNNTLVSKSIFPPNKIKSIEKILHPQGGPTLILTDMEIGNSTPQCAIDMTTFLVYAIINERPDIDVTVLTCFRKTTRALQKAIALRLELGNKVLIETIARVQGLTTDVTVFFIPNTSLNRSLESRLFNVATSRAKEHTIIIADKNILNYSTIPPTVRIYLEKLRNDKCIYIPSRPLDGKPLGLINMKEEVLGNVIDFD